MNNFIKKSFVMILALSITATLLTGCKFSDSMTVGSVDGVKIPYGVANFYVRYNQSTFEEQYPQYGYDVDTMWRTNQTSGTLESTTKKQFKDDLAELYVLKNHAKDYDYSVSKEDKKLINEAVEKILNSNDKEELKKVSGTKKYITDVLTLLTIKEQLKAIMLKDVDTNVSDEEALQKRMYYAEFEFTESVQESTEETEDTESTEATESSEDSQSDDDSATDTEEEATKKANDFLINMKAKNPTKDNFVDLAKDDEGITATEQIFGKDDETPSKTVVEAADKLKSGEYTTVKDGSKIYAIYLMSDHDEDGIKTKKESIIEERKNDEYDKIYKKLKKESDIKFNLLWKSISLYDLGIKKPETAQEDTSSDATSDTTSDTESTDTETADTSADTQTE